MHNVSTRPDDEIMAYALLTAAYWLEADCIKGCITPRVYRERLKIIENALGKPVLGVQR